MDSGTTLGHYKVLSLLGKGGMGEVWRARDTKLGREVAIKTLPEEFAKDADRLARFEREAKLLASLNHPNIAAIYGLEESNGTRFLVLELVDGDTLADQIKRGALPVEESLKLALQIAEALEAAHEKGVIHRDLKPANIKVTPDGNVKVLDFGLAKAFAGDESGVDVANSPTLSMQATQQGIILGTAAYMSPEQAKGLATDTRTDVWAFGAVLYEMLTSRQVFAGEDVSTILARVLERDPDFTALPEKLNPKLRDALRRCLQKNAKQRYHAIADIRLDIETVLSDPSGVLTQPVAEVAQSVPQSKLPWVASVVLGMVVASVAIWNLKPDPTVEVARFVLPDVAIIRSANNIDLAISPDGRHIVYPAAGGNGLYVRAVDQLEETQVASETAPFNPFFSPDSGWIGFHRTVDRALMKISVLGGPAVKICDLNSALRGASWSPDDDIIFGTADTANGLMRVSAGGGEPELLTTPETGQNHLWPEILPDGNAVLFTITGGEGAEGFQVAVLDLETDQQRVLIPGGANPRYVSTGHIVYGIAGTLRAVAFDAARLRVLSDPVPVLGGIETRPDGAAQYALSRVGSLVYIPGDAGSAEDQRTLALVDRNGNLERLNVPPREYLSPRLSPDGNSLAVQTEEDELSAIWIYDLSSGAQMRRLTLAQDGNNVRPVWTPDGQRITFSSNRDGTDSIWWQRADGSGAAERLIAGEDGSSIWPEAWSPGGQTLSFAKRTEGMESIWTLSLGNEPELFYDITDSRQFGSAFSPNGQWLAYWSGEGGSNEIYVQPFPAVPGVRHQITQNSGAFPLWSPDGNELFYRPSPAGLGILNRIGIDEQPIFSFSSEQALPVEEFVIVANYRGYDITPDGQRFLMVFTGDQTDAAEPARPQINIVLNWFEELKQRVPVP